MKTVVDKMYADGGLKLLQITDNGHGIHVSTRRDTSAS